ncbi:hypothetical protein [Bilophila wadsworthia]|uniref:hypothetical protein n=1 Tax=Bilophila wadsworthia TaxID=35833 RepID=UPI003990D8BB
MKPDRRGCDLRLKSARWCGPRPRPCREESADCAALVRGQMLAKAGDGELSTSIESHLADIDESGFVTDASRLVPDAAPLPRSRQIARLREVISCSPAGLTAILGRWAS